MRKTLTVRREPRLRCWTVQGVDGLDPSIHAPTPWTERAKEADVVAGLRLRNPGAEIVVVQR